MQRQLFDIAVSVHQVRLHMWAAFAVCAIFITGCSSDPHTLIVDNEHKENFSSLVTNSKGLTPDELVLLKDAESRSQKSHASDKVVGKTIGDVIGDQRKWQADRQQLAGKIEPVYRSAKAIQAATGVGINFAKYGELLQAFATELNVANDKLSTEEERRVASLFLAAFQAYKDGATLWQHQINNTSNEDTYGVYVFYSFNNSTPKPEIKAIVDTYHLGVHNGSIVQSLPKDFMQVILVVADSKLREAVDAYLVK